MMLVISPVMVTIFLVTVPASILLTRYLTNKFQPLFRQRSAKLGELNGLTEELLSGEQTTKVYHQEETMITRFGKKNEEAMTAYYNAEYYGSMTGPSVNFINNVSLSLISILGAFLFLFGHLTLGKLSSFVLYSRKFSGPINELANIFSDLQSSIAAAERIFKLLDEDPEVQDVRFDHVSFGYQADQPVIKDLSFDISAGSVVAIVGPTGAGKTTIVNLLMRFYDPDSGAIYLDGQNIKEATRSSLRKQYAMVLQDTWLFTGTIFENLTYGNVDATLEEVIKATKAAHIHDFIAQLPKGYDTVMTEDGLAISQGQKQLLTIARAMLLNAELLILDEATSNVDTQTELQIQEAMGRLMVNKTSFIIAHRLSTIREADLILVVNDGNIVEQGNHEELLAKQGRYYQLHQAQFEN
jgi:ATP-binding cassette subfamily B protein